MTDTTIATRLDDEKSYFQRLRILIKQYIYAIFIPIIGNEDVFPIIIKLGFYLVEAMQVISFAFDKQVYFNNILYISKFLMKYFD